MKTPTGEPYTIQGCYGPVTRYTYPCKFELECSKYNPARTLTVTVGIKDHPETNRKIVKPNPCTNGGGISCSSWKHFTSKDIGWYEPLPRRSFSPKNYNRNHIVEHVFVDERVVSDVTPDAPIVCPVVDVQEVKLRKLKSLEKKKVTL